MSKIEFDPIKFKDDQRKSWDSAATGWDKWWPIFERAGEPVSRRLLELAFVQKGDRVLDIATGVGEPALTAAKIVGKEGFVIAADQSGEMLKMARDRAKLQGITNVDFRETDCEEIKLDDNSLNAIICRWGFMFMPNLNDTLNRLYNALKPGGSISAAVWSNPQKVPIVSFVISSLSEIIEIPKPPDGTPNPFCLSDTNKLETIFKQSGFTGIHIEKMNVKFVLSSIEDYTNYIKDISSHLKAIFKDKSVDEKNEIWKHFKNSAKKLAKSDGSIHMDNETICIAAQKRE
ncbi:MAG: class I SAM-dependent methyltransferase [Spirochaetota bacterium]|nr:class I SAM-dependent methyltransferase [Spirochaetota bacterium]